MLSGYNSGSKTYMQMNKYSIEKREKLANTIIYFADKIPYFISGYSFERYQKNLEKCYEDALVIVFGHTHQIENRWVNNRLFFNSGSAYDSGNDGSGPTVGIIEIFPDQSVKGSIIPLRKAKWTKTGWIINEKSSYEPNHV